MPSFQTLSYPLIFLAAFACALVGLNPTFYLDDSPEFPTAAALLGIVHPPGYPLYTLLGRLTASLPFPPCFCANLTAALLGSLVCVLLFHLLRGLLRLPFALSLAFSLLWMGGATSYRGALSAKTGIYELTAVFLLTVLICCLEKRWVLASVALGLSFTNHWMSMVAYLPGLLVLALDNRPKEGGKNFQIPLCALGILLGFSPYLYLPLRATLDPAMNWGYPSDLHLFLNHISRAVDEGKDMTFQPGRWIYSLAFYGYSTINEFYGIGLLALPGFWVFFQKRREWLRGLVLTWVGFVTAVVVFSKYSGEKLYLIQDYSLSSMALVLIFSAMGAFGLISVLKRYKGAVSTVGLICLAVALGAIGWRIHTNRETNYTYTYDYALNSWKALPKGALFICSGDALEFPAWYLQWAEGKRPDLCVAGSELVMDWFRIQLAHAHPNLTVPKPFHEKGQTYWYGPLSRFLLESNRNRPSFLSYVPDPREQLQDLSMAPWGLALKATLPPEIVTYTEQEHVWNSLRLRHFGETALWTDPRTQSFLGNYGTARQWKAYYEIRLVGTATASKAKNWYRKSLIDFLWIHEQNPEDIETVMNVGANYLFLGEIDQAREWIARASGGEPTDAELFYDGGVLAYQAGSLPAAKRWFKKSLDADPSYSRAKQALGQLAP
ncbi:MAG TPA: DUF2723 domain-containing protein [bacterium]|nr:DUF2723 domain-containing protein [bacterium]